MQVKVSSNHDILRKITALLGLKQKVMKNQYSYDTWKYSSFNTLMLKICNFLENTSVLSYFLLNNSWTVTALNSDNAMAVWRFRSFAVFSFPGLSTALTIDYYRLLCAGFAWRNVSVFGHSENWTRRKVETATSGV